MIICSNYLISNEIRCGSQQEPALAEIIISCQPAAIRMGIALVEAAAAFSTEREVQTDVNSNRAHQQIKHWLEECDSDRCCVRESGSILPMRVVEVALEDSSDTPRLLITEAVARLYWVSQQGQAFVNR